MDDGGDANEEKDVDDITTDDVADEDVCITADEGRKRDSELRCASAKSDNGETDEEFTDFEIGGNGGSAIHEPIGAFDKKNETDDEKKNL